MKIRFSELEHAIRTLDNAVMRATSDQHFEDAVGFKTAANLLRSMALNVESAGVKDMPASAYKDPQG